MIASTNLPPLTTLKKQNHNLISLVLKGKRKYFHWNSFWKERKSRENSLLKQLFLINKKKWCSTILVDGLSNNDFKG